MLYIRVAQINKERFNIDYSVKNIPIPSEREYIIQLISKIEKLNLFTFIKAMYVCTSQTCLKTHSLNPKVFNEIAHVTFLESQLSYQESSKHFRQARGFVKVSAHYCLFFHQMIAFQKLWKTLENLFFLEIFKFL